METNNKYRDMLNTINQQELWLYEQQKELAEAKREKVCEYTSDYSDTVKKWIAQCGGIHYQTPAYYTYCPFCGGKIKVVESE